jgi:chromosome segregation ATPase
MNAYEEDRTIISGLQREKQELQEQMKARDQELSGYRISVTELEGKIREVETDRDRRNRDMGSQIARLSQEKEQLKQQLEERQSSLSALEGETADQKSLKSELKQQEDEIQRLRADLQKQMNAYEEDRTIISGLQRGEGERSGTV